MLSVSSRPRRRNAGRPPEKSARGFLQWIRGRECVFALKGDCEGKIEAMHLDFAGGKGMATKVADRFSIPACSKHHRTQHAKGWQTFMRLMGVTADELLNAAERLWKLWPGRVKWEAAND